MLKMITIFRGQSSELLREKNLINGKKIKRGDVLIGFASNGLHTNGYSLARKVLLDKYSLNKVPRGFSKTLGAELLKIHKSYLKLITYLNKNISVKGFSHITGGGIVGNTMRLIHGRPSAEYFLE